MVSENILAMDDSINKNKDLFINLLKGKIKKNDLIWLRASELEQETKDWAFKLLRDNMRDMYVKVGDHGLLSVQGGEGVRPFLPVPPRFYLWKYAMH